MEAPANEWKPGDRCHWTRVGGRGRTLSMRRSDGVVVAINPGGKTAAVLPDGSKRNTVVEIARLRRPEAKSAVTEFVEIMVEGSRREPSA